MSPLPHSSLSGGAPAAFVEPVPVWQQRCRGLRWTDMPGGDTVLQKIHFALWRRGLVKVITDGAAPTGHRLGGRLLPRWGKGASDGEDAALTPGHDVNAEMDVSADADVGFAAVAPGKANEAAKDKDKGTVKGKGKEKSQGKGQVKPKARTAAGRAAARRRRTEKRLNAMCQPGEEAAAGRGSRKMRRDLPELLRLAERIRVAAEAAGLPMEEAARLGGMPRCSLKPSQLAKSGPKHRARMMALLEELVQRNHPTREGA